MPTADSRLAGIRVLVTRPAPRGAGLAQKVNAAGGDSLLFPTIEIIPIDPSEYEVGDLAVADTIIFISVNSVRHGYPIVEESGAAEKQFIAIGPATAAALQASGCRGPLLSGTGGTSEDLLNHPDLENMAGRRVCIVRGAGGREHLRKSLASRGARVTYLECYRRRRPAAPDTAALEHVLERNGDLVVSATSVEGLSNLIGMVPSRLRRQLLRRPLVVIGARQRDAAEDNGWLGPVLESRAGDDHIVDAIVAWHDQR